MKLLAIETATEACSAALEVGGVCRSRHEIAPGKHTELILPMVEDLLNEADTRLQELDAIAFGKGPGAFTGVRIAVGVVQGLAFAHKLPVIPISTLAALAQQYSPEHDHVATAIDARIHEVYWGLFKKDEQGLMQPVIREIVCSPDDVIIKPGEQWFGAGTGWGSYCDELKTVFGDGLSGIDGCALPGAGNILTLAKPLLLNGETVPAEEAMPTYIRNKVVTN